MGEARENVDRCVYRLGELSCEGCGQQAALFAPGWRADHVGERYTDELPTLAFHCPDCAASERYAT